jgi:hypothetical protein
MRNTVHKGSTGTRPKRSRWLLSAFLVGAIGAGTWAAAGAPKNLGRAIEAQRALVSAQPANAAALTDLGNLLQIDGQNQPAEEAYRQALKLDPASTRTHFNLAVLLQSRGREAAALREYGRVVKLEPKHAWAFYQIGALHERSGRRSSAVRAYARAFSIDPRLRFPDVNPQIVGSLLTTEAALYAYRNLQPTSGNRALPEFSDPRHIAELLSDTPAQATPATAPPAAPSLPKAPQSGATPGGAAGARAPGSSARSVGAADVAPGSRSGLVTGGGQAGPGASRIYQPPADYQPAPQPEEPEPGSLPQGGIGPDVIPGAVFVPGVQSSGRLEHKLFRYAKGHRLAHLATSPRGSR